jgi:hypothetical protein
VRLDRKGQGPQCGHGIVWRIHHWRDLLQQGQEARYLQRALKPKNKNGFK